MAAEEEQASEHFFTGQEKSNFENLKPIYLQAHLCTPSEVIEVYV